MWRAQHIGHHVTAWQQAGHKEMPIAVAIGWEPSLGFVAGSPVPKGLCEYDVIGAIRGEPVELVKCETVDLQVPASAEIVIEGYLELDPETYTMEGPFAEVHRLCRRRPLAEADHPRDLPSPIAPIRSCAAPSRARCPAASPRTACAPRSCARRPPGTCSTAPACRASPTCGARRCRPASTSLVQIKQSYRGQAKQVANALWGSSAAHVRYKHVTVVDEDIDIHDYAAVDWAIAYPRQCRRERHRHHAGDLRRRARSVDAAARPQRRRSSAPANGTAC